MISAITLVDIRGSSILVARFYRNDVTRSDLELFCQEIVTKRGHQSSPCIEVEGVSHLTLSKGQMLLIASTTRNINAALALEFLVGLDRLLKLYLGR